LAPALSRGRGQYGEPIPKARQLLAQAHVRAAAGGGVWVRRAAGEGV